jgi:hypothetical protein
VLHRGTSTRHGHDTILTIILHEGDKAALQYLGAAVVLQWSNLPEDMRKALLQQTDSVGGLPLVSYLHEQIQALISRARNINGQEPTSA